VGGRIVNFKGVGFGVLDSIILPEAGAFINTVMNLRFL